jgi:hypothetical protein
MATSHAKPIIIETHNHITNAHNTLSRWLRDKDPTTYATTHGLIKGEFEKIPNAVKSDTSPDELAKPIKDWLIAHADFLDATGTPPEESYLRATLASLRALILQLRMLM